MCSRTCSCWCAGDVKEAGWAREVALRPYPVSSSASPPPLTIEVVLEEPEGHVGQMIDLGGVGADVIVVGGVEADIVQCRYAGNEGGECGEDGGGEAGEHTTGLKIERRGLVVDIYMLTSAWKAFRSPALALRHQGNVHRIAHPLTKHPALQHQPTGLHLAHTRGTPLPLVHTHLLKTGSLPIPPPLSKPV